MSQPPLKPGSSREQRRGLTLIELMVTLAITAILVALAIPSMHKLIAQRRVAGVAKELVTDLRYLRSLSIQNAAIVQLDFASNETSTCYMLSIFHDFNKDACDCTDPNSCQSATTQAKAVKTMSLRKSDGVTFNFPASLDSYPLRFSGLSAMPYLNDSSSETITGNVSSDLGGKVRIWTNKTGRVFACSESGQESNFPACPK